MEGTPMKDCLSSDLDYTSEVCRIVLGLEPCRYKLTLSGEGTNSLKQAEKIVPMENKPLVGVCKSGCHRCAVLDGGNRWCAKACPNGAIGLDDLNCTVIDESKCDSCGKCLMACPYGVIQDKSCIYQIINAFSQGKIVYALIVPEASKELEGQFSSWQVSDALRLLGFYDDINAEGEHIITIKSEAAYISNEVPDAQIALIVKDTAKKLEAENKHNDLDIDYVLTFDELLGMFNARGITADVMDISGNGECQYS
jgi:Fe-S-cluster-containing hydrogenase component 2